MLKRSFAVGFLPFALSSFKTMAQVAAPPAAAGAKKPKVALVATIEVAPGRMDEYLPLAKAHRARCLRDEPGTLALEYLRVQGEPNKVLVYEVFSDDAAFDAHASGASLKRIRQEILGMALSNSAVRCTPVE